ncbi:hypothetical protein D3C73_1448550 [compost metagenome]
MVSSTKSARAAIKASSRASIRRPARMSRSAGDRPGGSSRATSSALTKAKSGALSLIQRVAKVVLPAPLGPATIRMTGMAASPEEEATILAVAAEG